MNDNCNAAFINASNCITVRSDLVHMVENLKIPYGRLWQWRRMSWMRKGEEVWLYISKISGWIYML